MAGAVYLLPEVAAGDTSNHAVKVTRSGSARPVLAGHRSYTAIPGDAEHFAYEFSFRLNGNAMALTATLNEPTDAQVYDSNNGAILQEAGDTSRFRYFDGTSYVNGPTLGSALNLNQWYHLRVEYNAENPTAGKISVFLDGNPILTDESVGDLSALLGAANRISFVPGDWLGAGAANGESFHIDNVRLETIPEPASLGFLGLDRGRKERGSGNRHCRRSVPDCIHACRCTDGLHRSGLRGRRTIRGQWNLVDRERSGRCRAVGRV